MCFKAAYGTLVHRLKNERRIWGQKYDLNIGQVWDWWMGWTVVNDKSNFSIICTKLWSSLQTHSSKISLFIQLFCCDLYLQGRCLTFLKQRGFLDFQTTNMGSFSPVALPAALPVSLTFLFFSQNKFLLWGDIFYLGDIDRKDRTHRHWKYLSTYSLKELLVRLFCSKGWSSLL